MRRIVWVAIGAAGGVLVYRRAEQAVRDARERGVVLSARQVGLSAVTAASAARTLAATAAQWSPPAASAPGSAAARVMSRPTSPSRTERGVQ